MIENTNENKYECVMRDRIVELEGNVSTLTQMVNSLTERIADVEGNVSTLTQTSESLRSKVTP